MKKINSKDEPRELTEYRKQPDACYDGPNFTPVKDAIRRQRLQEQHNLCCYCEGKLHWDDTTNTGNVKLDHWHCQTRYKTEQLRYNNIIAACSGESSKPKQIHCDTCKGDSDLKYNPAEHDVGVYISFQKNGVISSTDEVFKLQLGLPNARNRTERGILNLNCFYLINQRKAKLDELRKQFGQSGTATKKFINKLIRTFANKEYCSIAIWYLSKKLKKAR